MNVTLGRNEPQAIIKIPQELLHLHSVLFGNPVMNKEPCTQALKHTGMHKGSNSAEKM